MQKSMQSTLLNARVCQVLFISYGVATAPYHSFPKAQGPLLTVKKEFSTILSLESPLFFYLFFLLPHVIQTYLEYTGSHCKQSLEGLPQVLLVLRKLFSCFEFYDVVFKVHELACYFSLFNVSQQSLIFPRKTALSWMCSLGKQT